MSDWYDVLNSAQKKRAKTLERMIAKREDELEPLKDEVRKLKDIAKVYRARLRKRDQDDG